MHFFTACLELKLKQQKPPQLARIIGRNIHAAPKFVLTKASLNVALAAGSEPVAAASWVPQSAANSTLYCCSASSSEPSKNQVALVYRNHEPPRICHQQNNTRKEEAQFTGYEIRFRPARRFPKFKFRTVAQHLFSDEESSFQKIKKPYRMRGFSLRGLKIYRFTNSARFTLPSVSVKQSIAF